MGGVRMGAPVMDDTEWSMGGTNDEAAAQAIGFTEQEVVMAAVYAYQTVTDPHLLKLSRERLVRGFFDAFRAGVFSYLDD